jgi:hypothetical protein
MTVLKGYNSGTSAWEPVAVGADVTNTLTTKGDLLGRSSSAAARLGVGANGTVLTADSAETTGLKWATPAAGGKVLQVVNATYSVQVASSSATYAATGLTATITPTSSSSKILITVHQTGIGKYNNTAMSLRLKRNSTQIVEFEQVAGDTRSSAENYPGGSGTTYLDSPATTSAITYSTDFASFQGIAGVQIQQNGCTSTITLMEIGA